MIRYSLQNSKCTWKRLFSARQNAWPASRGRPSRTRQHTVPSKALYILLGPQIRCAISPIRLVENCRVDVILKNSSKAVLLIVYRVFPPILFIINSSPRSPIAQHYSRKCVVLVFCLHDESATDFVCHSYITHQHCKCACVLCYF